MVELKWKVCVISRGVLLCCCTRSNNFHTIPMSNNIQEAAAKAMRRKKDHC